MAEVGAASVGTTALDRDRHALTCTPPPTLQTKLAWSSTPGDGAGPVVAASSEDGVEDGVDREARASQILSLLFNLKHQRLVTDFSCALRDGVLYHGRLYITQDAVCFYSNIFGRETRKILPFRSMVRVEKSMAVYVFPTLDFVMHTKGGSEKRVSFTSFFSTFRDECHNLVSALLRTHVDTHGAASIAWVASPGAAAAAMTHLMGGGDPTSNGVGETVAAVVASGEGTGVATTLLPPPPVALVSKARKRSDSLPSGMGRSASLSEMDRASEVGGGEMAGATPLGGGGGGDDFVATPASLLTAGILATPANALGTVRSTGSMGGSSTGRHREPSPTPSLTTTATTTSGTHHLHPAKHRAGRRRTAVPRGRGLTDGSAMMEQGSSAMGGGSHSGGGGGVAGATSRHSMPHKPHSKPLPPPPPATTTSTTAATTVATAPSAGKPPAVDTVEPTFPPLPSSTWARVGRMRLVCDVVLPMSTRHFQRMCLDDDAPFHLGAIHQGQRAFDITMGSWVEAKPATGESGPIIARTVRLTMPLEPGPLMPAQTRVEKQQRWMRYSGGGHVVDTVARSLDVPFGDYFVTEDTWMVLPLDAEVGLEGHGHAPPVEVAKARRWAEEHGRDPTHLCRFLVFVHLNFSKWTILKGQITSRAEKSTITFYEAVVSHLHTFLLESGGADADAHATASAASSSTRGMADLTPSSTLGAVAPGLEFTSPSLDAALANPALAIHKDAVMATLVSPSALHTLTEDELRRQYTQLYAAHGAVLQQLRQVQEKLVQVTSGSKEVVALPPGPSWDTFLPANSSALAIVFVAVAVVVVVVMVMGAQWRLHGGGGTISPPAPDLSPRDMARLVTEVAARLRDGGGGHATGAGVTV